MARQPIGQLHDWSKSDWGSIHFYSSSSLGWHRLDLWYQQGYDLFVFCKDSPGRDWKKLAADVSCRSIHFSPVAGGSAGAREHSRMRWVTFGMIGDRNRRGKHPPMITNGGKFNDGFDPSHFVEVRLWPLVCTAHWIQTTCSAGSGQICGLMFKATEVVQCKIGNVLLIRQFRHGSIKP